MPKVFNSTQIGRIRLRKNQEFVDLDGEGRRWIIGLKQPETPEGGPVVPPNPDEALEAARSNPHAPRLIPQRKGPAISTTEAIGNWQERREGER